MNKTYLLILLLFGLNVQSQTPNLNQADSLMALGNYSKAIEVYQAQTLTDNEYLNIAKAYISLGNYAAALENYEKGVLINPQNVLLKYEYAKLLFNVKKFSEAAKMFDELILSDYRNPNYHYQKGLVLEQLKDSTAYDRFWSAYQLDSTHQKAIYKLAKHQLKLKNFESAHRYANKGLVQYENNKELISIQAQTFYFEEKYNQAILWFKKLLELNEESSFIYEKLSYCYAYNSDYNEAIEATKKAIKLEPDNATNLYVLAQLYERNNDFENAEKYMLIYIQLQDQPLDKEYTELALIYNRLKQYDKGIEMLKKAIKENPSNIESHFFLVNTKDKYYKDIDAKIQAYKDFIVRFPKSPYSKYSEVKISKLEKEKFLKQD